MEFPLYQWTVVGVSNATGLELTQSGRLVSLLCFYLMLPFLYLLLGRLGLPWWSRLVVLGPVVGCPLYIFYGRAFLVETMALWLALVFLWAYLNTVERGRWGWLAVAAVAGFGAGLVKVTTFIFILMPALLWTLAWLWQARAGGWRAVLQKAAWGLGAVALPCAVAYWWIQKANAIKALNPAADFLNPTSMNSYFLGYGAHFSWEIWRHHFAIIFREIVAWWSLALAGGLALVFGQRWWGGIALLVGLFFGVQMLFPILYAYHEYYYVANAFTLMMALGLALCGVLESRLPRWAAWALVLAVTAGQVMIYFQIYYPMQRGRSNGGSPITQALRVATEPDDVLVVAGNDWSSITPYFARRRALMIRSGIEHDAALLDRDFTGLKGETVGALVLHGAQRNNRELLQRAVKTFGLDPRPVFTCLDATIYFHRRLRLAAIPLVKAVPDAQFLQLTPESIADENKFFGHEVLLADLSPRFRGKFAAVTPLPVKYFATFGVDIVDYDGKRFLSTHPDTRLWFEVPAGRRAVSIEALLLPGAYAAAVLPGDRSDGFEVRISKEGSDGNRLPVFSRWINPRDQPADRGLQTINQKINLAEGEVVVIEILPGPQGNAARDWALLGRVEIK